MPLMNLVPYMAAVILCLSSVCTVQHDGPARLDAAITDDMKTHSATSPTQTGDGPEMMQSFPGTTQADLIPEKAPCFLDDIFTVMHDSLQTNDELTNNSLTLFGICTASENSSDSILLELSQKTKIDQRNKMQVLHPREVLVAEDERGALTLTLDLPPSPLLSWNPVLLLIFGGPITEGEPGVITLSSEQLQPSTQLACISAGTQYILMRGKTSQSVSGQKWSISVETKSPHINRQLKEFLIGGRPQVNVGVTLLYFGEGGSDPSYADSRQTFYFLCELRRFLVDVLPQAWPGSTPLKLDSLQSLPSLPLGLSSSEVLLATLINSTSPTIFAFTSSVMHQHRGELALPAARQEELGLRLQQTTARIMEVLRAKEQAEEGGHATMRKLRRLQELTTSPKVEPTSGVSQYRRFLLLKALQTVGRDIKRQPRTTRAEPRGPERSRTCGLRSLTVSLERHLVSPNTANINNCQGSCSFPMENTNNHAILLNAHIESGDEQQRSPCCVPVLYDSLQVVDLNERGTFLSIKPDMVARKCGCR